MRGRTFRVLGTGVLLFAITHDGRSVERGGVPGAYYSRDINSVVVSPSNPSTLYVGTTHSGVFKSTDAGGSWTDSSVGLTISYIYALAIDPTENNTLYAATGQCEIFKSTNAGGTWTTASSGLPGQCSVHALAVDPASPGTLFAGTYGLNPTDPRGVVFKSVDSGSTWVPSSSGLTWGVNTLAIGHGERAALYAGTASGVFRSTDSGGSWVPASTGLRDRPPFVTSLLVDPVTPTRIYAGTYGGVFISTDSGGSWVKSSKGLVETEYDVVHALAVTRSKPLTLYAGFENVSRSTDYGATWNSPGSGPKTRFILSLAVDPVSPRTLYAGADFNNVYKSTDAGNTWAASRKGLPVFSLSDGAK